MGMITQAEIPMSTTATAPAAPKTYTPDDLLRMPDDGRTYELVNGELRAVGMSKESSRIGGMVYFFLQSFCQPRNLGWVFPIGAGFRCFRDDPGRVRKPDVAFIALDRMPPATYQDEGFCTTVPDLVAEVISPNDLASELEEKRDEWLAAGVKVVWIVDPATRTVRIHRADGTVAFLREADTLTGADVLPGFACPVADLFRLPGVPA
jgi:Uma2 family endonuclease